MRRQQSNNQVAQNLNKLQNCQAAIKKAHKGKTKAYEKDHDRKSEELVSEYSSNESQDSNSTDTRQRIYYVFCIHNG